MSIFNPKAVLARLEALEKKFVGDAEAVPADVEARLKVLEEGFEKLLPILPLLRKNLDGEVAGNGASETAGVVIPASELGEYIHLDKTSAATEARTAASEKAAS